MSTRPRQGRDSGRRSWMVAVVVTCVLIIGAALLIPRLLDGGASSDAGAPPATPPAPPPVVPTTAVPAPHEPKRDLTRYLEQCEKGTREWRAAQVDFPGELILGVGDTKTYVAAVDIRDQPAPPSDVIGLPSQGEPAAVKCEVAARLTPVGNGLAVDDEDWMLRSFDPTGVIRWAWAVRALQAENQDLRLEIQPAVRSTDGIVQVSDGSTTIGTFITHVTVEQSFLGQVDAWLTENWGKVATIAATLGAAALALIRWGGQLREALATARGRERGRR